MSIYSLAILILGGVVIMVVIYCLLAMAQQADAYLDQLGLGEGGGGLENRPIGLAESPEEVHEDRGAWSMKS